ncbi:MAG TPA: aminotransferase class I/II-fold pyridoxal phosphate-dependent enzyme [Candidatus Melainabacteria bacterium]|nr:aminotransferase class I/II-fold pyridoxal phosphate-dependent enzyme [Candidatus Melainabacteria bacterium]
MSKSLSLKPLSKTALEVPFSGIRRFFDIAASMQDVVSLGVGEPDFVTPWCVREAAIYSLERGQTTYTSNYGLLELRREISRYLNKRYLVEYNPETEILVTVGVSEGLDLAMRVLLNPGDEVLIPEPCYVSYRPCVALAGGVPVGVETSSDAKFAVTAEQLKAACTERTKAILLGYPSNPTGAVLNRDQVIEIINFARDRGLYVVSDEIYDRLTYDGIHTCVASVPGAREITILLNGFSKAHAMTGWRIAYACAPEHILKMMMKIHSYTMLCAPITGQIAAIEALKHAEKEVEDMVAHYRQRRRLIVDGLNKIGLTCHMPQGAFYAFPSIKTTGLTAEQFAERLLLEERVAVVPGTAFGAGGDGHIRCSYATSVEKLELALARMHRFIEKLHS